MGCRTPPSAVDISSDSDFTPSPPRFFRRLDSRAGGAPTTSFPPPPPAPAPPLIFACDDPTPQKPGPSSSGTPSFVPETPLSPLVRCTFASSERISGETLTTGGLICLESDNESEDIPCRRKPNSGLVEAEFRLLEHAAGATKLPISEASDPNPNDSDDECVELQEPTNEREKSEARAEPRNGTSHYTKVVEEGLLNHGLPTEVTYPQLSSSSNGKNSMLHEVEDTFIQTSKTMAVDTGKKVPNNLKEDKKKTTKEERAQLVEDKKRKRQEERLQKEAHKAELKEMKKAEKEKQKWEKGKYAIKSIIAEIDTKIIESGTIGGQLVTRFADKGLSFHVTSNPIENSIVWNMSVPDEIAQVSPSDKVVSYILFIYQAEEFCVVVSNESFFDHVQKVQNLYPDYTVCFLINKLTSYLNKREQQHFKSQSGSNWKRPPVEEVLSMLTTHFTKVHSRLCIDEAELAEHVVGLTSSLASCQFRKKPTWLSINSNGSIIPKGFIDKDLIKKSVWLKALIAIPKVQPRFALAIWKKYPTMRSLLNVYMDQTKSVHEKEFLLKDLMVEGVLQEESRRLGEACSKRVYRVLMAPSGDIITDDVEDGAGFFVRHGANV